MAYQLRGFSGPSTSRVTSKSGGREAAEAMEVRVRVRWSGARLWFPSSSSSSSSSSSGGVGSMSARDMGWPRACSRGERGFVSVEEGRWVEGVFSRAGGEVLVEWPGWVAV